MWWSRLLLGLAVLGLGPAGCGFQPIYARDSAAPSPVASDLAGVQVSGILTSDNQDRLGQQLRNALVSSLSPRGEPAKARYYLDVKVTESLRGLANSRDGNATVGEVSVMATYTLSDINTRSNGALFAGEASAYGGFRYLGPRYGSTVAERDSETAAVNDLANAIRGDLAAFFANRETFTNRMKQRAVSPFSSKTVPDAEQQRTPLDRPQDVP
jgi:LPS-assembly lipoprotein